MLLTCICPIAHYKSAPPFLNYLQNISYEKFIHLCIMIMVYSLPYKINSLYISNQFRHIALFTDLKKDIIIYIVLPLHDDIYVYINYRCENSTHCMFTEWTWVNLCI